MEFIAKKLRNLRHSFNMYLAEALAKQVSKLCCRGYDSYSQRRQAIDRLMNNLHSKVVYEYLHHYRKEFVLPEESIKEYFLRMANKGENYRLIISRYDGYEISALFENISDADREEAEKFLYEISKSRYYNDTLDGFEDWYKCKKFLSFLFENDTDDEINRALSCGSSRFWETRTQEFAEKYLLEKKDVEKIRIYLSNENVHRIGDDLASTALSMGLFSLVIRKSIPEKTAWWIINHASTDKLLEYAKSGINLSALGVRTILDKIKDKISEEDCKILNEIAARNDRSETEIWLAETYAR